MAKALDRGEAVDVSIKINYIGNSKRPDSFDVKYKIVNRDIEARNFKNPKN